MCGIAGYFGITNLPDGAIDAVMAAIARRGPDASAVVGWREGRRLDDCRPAHQLLFHTRLSIRDLSGSANQPMANDDQSLWLVYNGEVYDWEPQRRLLETRGVRFRTTSDTEFILRGYEAWGMEALLPKLRGMFSFALFDLRRGKVHMARDRMGLKPLVYHHDQAAGRLAFGSTVRSVLPMLPAEQRVWDAQAIDAYLAHRTIPAPRTVLAGLRRLENAHCLEWDLATGELRKTCYWTPSVREADAAQVLDDAVRLRTVADRPVGVFLSGGIDSSVVTSRLAAQGYGNIRTFTAGFPEAELDESALAREVARQLEMPHVSIDMGRDVGRDFARVVEDFDEPFADPSCFPTWALAREVAKSVKVVLCGDGGDEMFAGYKRYRQHLRTAWRRHLPRLALLRPGAQFPPGKGARLRYEAASDWVDAYTMRFASFTAPEREALQPDLGRLPPHHWRMPEGGSRHSPSTSALQSLLEVDRLNYLPEYILRKADLATMAHGLEGRAPLLDHHFVEALQGLPVATRFTRPPKRWLVERCGPCRSLGMLERKKRGFNPSVSAMLRGDLGERLGGLGARLHQLTQGQLRAATVDEVTRAWREGLGYAEQLLQLLMLDECLDQLARAARPTP